MLVREPGLIERCPVEHLQFATHRKSPRANESLLRNLGAEILEESERFQQMFRDFNIDYFGGKLQEYEVRVVYDQAYWLGDPLGDAIDGYTDPDRLRIHEMAYAATDPFTMKHGSAK